MRRGLFIGIALVAGVAVTVSWSSGAGVTDAEKVPSRPLVTALMTPELASPERRVSFAHIRSAGAAVVRLTMWWSAVSPRGEEKPEGFEPRNPGDALYRWEPYDEVVRAVVAAGLQPIVTVADAPVWAQGCSRGPGPCRPRPSDLADFMTAAARRYGGGYRGLPRVRYWQIWNEPNLDSYLMPQYDENGRPESPDLYRTMVNASADAIHAVRKDNIVIAGGQSPFGPDAQSTGRTAPLTFMRQLLCLSAERSPRRVCDKKVRFDVWAHHPYTSGGPTHHANNPNDVSAPDLWKMRVLLEAGARTGNLQSRGPVAFWVTEFAWDTSPPDPKGVPEALHARWVSEVLYRMWNQGVSLVTWFLIRDQPFTSSTPFQSGLYFRGENGIASDKPKLALTAFRFPFVAFRDSGTRQVEYWGRSPRGRASVIVEVQVSGEWRHVATVRPNSSGIFAGRFTGAARKSLVRARLANGKDAALPFSLVVPPDRPGCAWGTC